MALMISIGSMFFSRARISMFCAIGLFWLLIVAALRSRAPHPGALWPLDEVGVPNLRIWDDVLLSVGLDEGHLIRGDPFYPTLEALPPGDLLRGADADDLAAAPLEVRLSLERATETGRADLEEVPVRDQIF